MFVKHVVLYIRFARRKHRQAGSLLQRPCLCASQGTQWCIVHRFLDLDGAVGSAWFTDTSYQVQKLLREALTLLKVPLASAFTLKSFRAGKATSMAANCDGLAAILQEGEWKSAAFLRYVSETEVDRMRMLKFALEEDEDED